MSLKLNRKASDPVSFLFDIDVDADLSNEVLIDGYSWGMLHIPANFDGTQIKFHTAPTKAGTYTEVIDPNTGSDITYTVAASKSCPMPPEVFGASYLKIESVTDQATTDTIITATFRS